MKVEIIRRISIDEVPSASGIALIGEKVFIVGDDSPCLFVYNTQFELLQKVKLFEPLDIEGEKIPKELKPDLEAVTIVRWKKQDYLFLLGSGSKPLLRDHGFLVSVKAPHQVRSVSLHDFYNSIRKHWKKIHIKRLNIEGAAFFEKQLLLFQRGNVSGKNLMLKIPWKKLRNHLFKRRKVPDFEVEQFDLPKVESLQLGFSGAEVVPGTCDILFTASAENTADEIVDGKITGSFIGILSMKKRMTTSPPLVALRENDQILPLKLESVSILKVRSKSEIEFLAVCDQDTQNSLLLHLLIQL